MSKHFGPGHMPPRPSLDAATIEGFVAHFLLDDYADRSPIPACHRQWWQMACSPDRHVAFAAPRDHAKTTAITHGFGLAAALFKCHPFQLKVSKTYKLACEKIEQAKHTLLNNAKIKDVFRVKNIPRDREDDFICEMDDGYEFRMVALGTGQAARGLSWRTIRPTLILGDDMEDDEEVLSAERREKTMRWLMNTLLPMGGNTTQFRIFGTILHNDSMLQRLLNMSSWKSAVWSACDEEISEGSILWPERYNKERLQAIKQSYIEAGNLAGFNMEYRNIAMDTSSGFFRPEDFLPMGERPTNLNVYAAVDFAISTKERRDFTVITIAGMDPEGFLYILDVLRGRWDGGQIIQEMLSAEETYHPQEWFVEKGAIQLALGPAMELMMRQQGETGRFMNLFPMTPKNDKQTRARSIQARMRARSVKFDKSSSWYPEFESECLQFPRGKHDDQVDSLAYIGLGLSRMTTPQTEEEEEEDLYWRARKEVLPDGRSPICGY